jgi:mono/diheme cytochrome c family protein
LREAVLGEVHESGCCGPDDHALATTGGDGKTLPCATCHGSGLQGMAEKLTGDDVLTLATYAASLQP